MRNIQSGFIVFLGLLLLTAGSQGLLANCTHLGTGFPIFQCGFIGWFAPPPAGSGTVSGAWWQIGYGNRRVSNGFGGGSLEGTGIGPAGFFSGNDSGLFQIVLTDPRTVLPQHAALIPPGSACSNFENGWAQPGVDGCADNPRTTGDDDNLLNPYFNRNYGPGLGYYTLEHQIDYPMAVLLRESTGRFFSVALIANKSRGTTQAEKDADSSEGFFDLAEVANGDANPVSGKLNVIPWQRVPVPRVDATSIDPNGQVTMALSWGNVRQVSDLSTRPSTAIPALASGGVGVLNFGTLVRYVLETAPLTSATLDPNTLTWTIAQTIPAPTSAPTVNTVLTVPRGTAFRIRTLLGRVSRTSSITTPNCRSGACGDQGFEATDCDGSNCPVSPPIRIIGGPLVSERAVEVVAARNGNAVTISWSTTSELNLESISILAVGPRGETPVREVPCKECTTGAAAFYEETLFPSDLKGARRIAIRLNGPGVTSEPIPVP